MGDGAAGAAAVAKAAAVFRSFEGDWVGAPAAGYAAVAAVGAGFRSHGWF